MTYSCCELFARPHCPLCLLTTVTPSRRIHHERDRFAEASGLTFAYRIGVELFDFILTFKLTNSVLYKFREDFGVIHVDHHS